MLHTNEIYCSLALWIRQFKHSGLNCVGHIHNGLYTWYPRWCSALIVKLAERITGEILNNFNIRQYGKYRTREYPRGTAREFT